MKNEKSPPASMLIHESDLYCCSLFKNELIALKDHIIIIYKELLGKYDLLRVYNYNFIYNS
jgi:hypothetical protein